MRLDKDRIAQCFLRSIHSYDTAAQVQNKLAGRLMQSLQSMPDSTFTSILEIGCCTGTLTGKLCSERPVQRLYCNDLVPEFEEVLQKRLASNCSVQFHPWFGDIEELPLPSELSLVVSGATFQWLSDSHSFLKRLGRELASGSCLAFSLFGPGTLKEFSKLTGVELEYVTDETLTEILEADFEILHYKKFKDILFFPTVREILVHIRDTGVGGVSEYKWSKQSLQEFEKGYKKTFGTDKGLPVSYSSSCFVARRR